MMKNKLLMLLIAALIGSAALNVALVVAVRAMYIEAKIQATLPKLDAYDEANVALRAEAPPNRRAVLFGDSRIAQWHPAPDPSGDWQIINRGISGGTTAHMRWRFRNDVLELRPRVVIIEAGINDLVAASLAPPDMAGEIVQRCIDNLGALVAEALAHDIEVVLLSVLRPARPPLYRRLVWSDSVMSLVEEVNRAIGRLSSTPGVTWMDTASVLQQADGAWQQGVTKDTLHLTSAGYERLNAAVTPLLDRIFSDAVQ